MVIQGSGAEKNVFFPSAGPHPEDELKLIYHQYWWYCKACLLKTTLLKPPSIGQLGGTTDRAEIKSSVLGLYEHLDIMEIKSQNQTTHAQYRKRGQKATLL